MCQLVYASRIEIVNTSQDSSLNSGLTELPSCPVCLERLVSNDYYGLIKLYPFMCCYASIYVLLCIHLNIVMYLLSVAMYLF